MDERLEHLEADFRLADQLIADTEFEEAKAILFRIIEEEP